MVVLGVDPGLNVTGYAALRTDDGPSLRALPTVLDAGVIRTPRVTELGPRLQELHAQARAIIEEHQPTVMAVERVFSHADHPRTAILMGHARGVLILAAAESHLAVVDLPPATVKRQLTGSGAASKAQMQRAIARLFGWAEPPEPPDVCDAIAIALAGLAHLRRQALAQRGRRPGK